MPLTISNSMLAAVALVTGLALPALAQKYTPEPPPLTTASCKPTKKVPCPVTSAPAATPASANPFPFPGEDQPDPAKPAPAAAPGQSAFPFPGEPAAQMPAPAPAESSSSSSFPDPTPDPDRPALKDEGSAGSTRFARKKLPRVSALSLDEREAEDIEVSRFYFSTGNFGAAYQRAKDATALASDDPEAHLALAEAATRVEKRDEAAAEYNACLKLDASEQQVKAAKKGLAELASAKPVKRAAK